VCTPIAGREELSEEFCETLQKKLDVIIIIIIIIIIINVTHYTKSTAV
jgi:hypothetical protein